MGPHKIRELMKSEREMAKRRFRRQRNKNYLAKPGSHECVIVLDHLKPTYNIGKIFRSADAFGARQFTWSALIFLILHRAWVLLNGYLLYFIKIFFPVIPTLLTKAILHLFWNRVKVSPSSKQGCQLKVHLFSVMKNSVSALNRICSPKWKG